jgi:hypothetical protein
MSPGHPISPRRRLATLGVAVGGVLAGHWLTYLAVAPTAGSRAVILHETGHAYLGMANDLALVVALAALATMFIGQLTRPAPAGQVQGLTARVVRFQVSAFVLLEVLERVTAGSPLTELIHTDILPIGIAAQVGIGYVAALAIGWLLHTADRVAAVFGRAAAPPRRLVPRPLQPELAFVPAGRHLSAAGVRGPPSSV